MVELDVVVVGAGSAGLGIGYHLQQAGLDFVILERGEIAETWRSQRWDSFAVNTPNWMNGLPGSPYSGPDPDAFLLRDELVETFERHAAAHSLPVRLHTTVTRVVRAAEPRGFVVETVDGHGSRASLHTRNVVVASGMMHAPKIPEIAQRFPASIGQLHAKDYRSADALPEGDVVVIGSGQSGCQITEDLIGAGRTVYLSTSRVARLPRRYRGSDATHWMKPLGMWDATLDDLEDPAMQFAAQPQVSGVGRRGRTVSLQGLHGRGVRLMGRLTDVADGVLTTDDSLGAHIEFADDFSARFKADVDAYIEANALDAPPPENDPVDVPAGPEVAADGITTLDLAGVSTVIWCTGFTAHFEWLEVPVTDGDGRPVHRRGVSPVPGIYFLGFPWLHSRKSGIIFGIDEDARYVADAIVSAMG